MNIIIKLELQTLYFSKFHFANFGTYDPDGKLKIDCASHHFFRTCTFSAYGRCIAGVPCLVPIDPTLKFLATATVIRLELTGNLRHYRCSRSVHRSTEIFVSSDFRFFFSFFHLISFFFTTAPTH